MKTEDCNKSLQNPYECNYSIGTSREDVFYCIVKEEKITKDECCTCECFKAWFECDDE